MGVFVPGAFWTILAPSLRREHDIDLHMELHVAATRVLSPVWAIWGIEVLGGSFQLYWDRLQHIAVGFVRWACRKDYYHTASYVSK